MPNCNGPDPTLSADLSIRINDSPDPAWWLSPDIRLFRLGAGGAEVSDGKAVLNADNYVDVRVYRTAQPFLTDTFDILVELWVCNPSLSMSPTVVTDTRRLFTGSIRATSPALTASSSVWLSNIPDPPNGEVLTAAAYPDSLGIKDANGNFDKVKISRDASRRIKWIPDSRDSVQQAGHKCLIARVYQDGLPDPKPDNDCFHVRPDDHVAQLNLEIVTVASKIKSFSFPIQTTGLSPEVVEGATIRAFADRVPSAAVLEAILPSLKQFEGFRQLAQIAPERFALQVPKNLSPVIRDNSRLEKITPVNPEDIPFQDKWRFVFRDGLNFGRFRDSVFNPAVVLQNAVADRKFNAALNVRNLQVSPELRIVPKLKITPKLEKLVEQAAPTFEADIKLPPKEVANVTFTANLPENSQPGDAHIFHVMHINEQKQVIGGLTIVSVVVDSVYPELVDTLTNQRNQLVKDSYLAIFGNDLPHGNNQRQLTACLRDLNYYFGSIIECCRQGNVEPLDDFIPSIKEMNNSLGYPNRWFVTFYQSIKQNHGLTDESANLVDSYLDHAINLLS